MDEKITKSIKIALIVYFVIVLFSFVFGGIYTEMYLEGLEFNITNLLLAFVGAFFVAIPFFILGFIITFTVLWIRKPIDNSND